MTLNLPDTAHPGDDKHSIDHNMIVEAIKALDGRTVQTVKGDKGDKGDQGEKGDNGNPGPQGIPGPEGRQGIPGPVGPAGPASTVPGPQGERGPQGLKGDKGDPGPASTVPGPAGPRGAEGPQGPKGDTGAVGPAGPKGDTGARGAQGVQGPVGPKGDKGDAGTGFVLKGVVADVASLPAGAAVGDAYMVTADNHVHIWDGDSWEDAGALQGPKGDPGVQGEVGPQGPEGPEGPAGPAGPKGDTGATGPAGAASTVPGPQGPQGEIGPQGPQGQPGYTGFFPYVWGASRSAAVDPGAGQVTVETTQGQGRTLALSETDADGVLRHPELIQPGDNITLTDSPAAGAPITVFARYVVTGVGTDHGSWWSFPMTRTDGTGTFNPPDGTRVRVVASFASIAPMTLDQLADVDVSLSATGMMLTKQIDGTWKGANFSRPLNWLSDVATGTIDADGNPVPPDQTPAGHVLGTSAAGFWEPLSLAYIEEQIVTPLQQQIGDPSIVAAHTDLVGYIGEVADRVGAIEGSGEPPVAADHVFVDNYSGGFIRVMPGPANPTTIDVALATTPGPGGAVYPTLGDIPGQSAVWVDFGGTLGHVNTATGSAVLGSTLKEWIRKGAVLNVHKDSTTDPAHPALVVDNIVLPTPAGSSLALSDLHDVNARTPNDGDALVWDPATSKWVAGPVAAEAPPFRAERVFAYYGSTPAVPPGEGHMVVQSGTAVGGTVTLGFDFKDHDGVPWLANVEAGDTIVVASFGDGDYEWVATAKGHVAPQGTTHMILACLFVSETGTKPAREGLLRVTVIPQEIMDKFSPPPVQRQPTVFVQGVPYNDMSDIPDPVLHDIFLYSNSGDLMKWDGDSWEYAGNTSPADNAKADVAGEAFTGTVTAPGLAPDAGGSVRTTFFLTAPPEDTLGADGDIAIVIG